MLLLLLLLLACVDDRGMGASTDARCLSCVAGVRLVWWVDGGGVSACVGV